MNLVSSSHAHPLAWQRLLGTAVPALLLGVGLTLSPIGQASAQTSPPASSTEGAKPGQSKPDAKTETKAETKPVRPTPLARQSTDQLFERLATASTPEEAKGIANLIQRRWARSGSDTADLLMSRAQEALKAGEVALGVEILDRLIAIEPDWAEGWNQRANAFFVLQDPVRSMLDIGEALKREPRHFGALGGLGIILRQQGNDKLALQAYRRVLTLYPQMEGVKEQVESLARDIDGRDI
jgi:tetratricopeptide (TPR) repeat protein